MREKIGLTVGCAACVAGIYAFWIGLALIIPPLAADGAWQIETKAVYLVFIALWLAGISVIAYLRSR